jgi:hypothetical protein
VLLTLADVRREKSHTRHIWRQPSLFSWHQWSGRRICIALLLGKAAALVVERLPVDDLQVAGKCGALRAGEASSTWHSLEQ